MKAKRIYAQCRFFCVCEYNYSSNISIFNIFFFGNTAAVNMRRKVRVSFFRCCFIRHVYVCVCIGITLIVRLIDVKRDD